MPGADLRDISDSSSRFPSLEAANYPTQRIKSHEQERSNVERRMTQRKEFIDYILNVKKKVRKCSLHWTKA